MNPDPLERRLDAYARHALPAAPANLHADVWREIERRRTESFLARLGWAELLRRPAWAAAGIAFAVAMGMIPAVAFTRAQEEKRLARASLHFGIFAPPRGPLATLQPQSDHPHLHTP